MYTLRQTQEFQDWLDGLKTGGPRFASSRGCVWRRLGNLGDLKSVGSEVSEMRVDVGSGYRLYFTRRGHLLIVMLAGGDKSSQQRDIKRAQRIVKQLEFEP